MVEVVICFIQIDPVLVFVCWLRLRQDGMVLFEERASETPKHVHDPVLILAVTVHCTRIKHHILHRSQLPQRSFSPRPHKAPLPLISQTTDPHGKQQA